MSARGIAAAIFLAAAPAAAGVMQETHCIPTLPDGYPVEVWTIDPPAPEPITDVVAEIIERWNAWSRGFDRRLIDLGGGGESQAEPDPSPVSAPPAGFLALCAAGVLPLARLLWRA